MQECICHFSKWQIHPFMSKGTIYLSVCYPLNSQFISLEFFTHFKLCLADWIHNFKWLKIIQIWQNEGFQICFQSFIFNIFKRWYVMWKYRMLKTV